MVGWGRVGWDGEDTLTVGTILSSAKARLVADGVTSQLTVLMDQTVIIPKCSKTFNVTLDCDDCTAQHGAHARLSSAY